MKTVIFDLDGTVIDSSHRHLAKPDGSLDLAAWIRNSTHEKVMQDKLLPLSQVWHGALEFGWRVVICTARVLSTPDHAFLAKHRLHAHIIYSRQIGDSRKDHDIKREQLAEMLANNPVSDCVMFDDNANVRKSVSELGIECLDPAFYNDRVS